MKTTVPNNPAPEVAHTPTPFNIVDGRIYGEGEYMICDVAPCQPGESEAPGINEQDEANAAFIVRACNSHASLAAENARLSAELARMRRHWSELAYHSNVLACARDRAERNVAVLKVATAAGNATDEFPNLRTLEQARSALEQSKA